MKVVVVESPAKAKTINKYLGAGYEVLASFGHIRDLPAKDGSVDPSQDFRMIWEVESRGAKRVAEIAKAVRGAEKLILATDPDREGEAISWHVVEALREKKVLKDTPIERVTFNAITKDAVLAAMRSPREIDGALVDAYLARRALDYLVGFTLSPVLWRKLPGARSAGRVQSVALRLVCDREREIESFVKREYWSIVAHLSTKDGAVFEARLVGADGTKINRLDVGTGEDAERFRRDLELATFRVASVEAKPAKRHPQPPFTTSTLQQEASRKLGFAPAHTMRVAQRLYEGVEIGGETVGLITYMRTDGVDMAPEAVSAARGVIASEYGDRYCPPAPRRYSTKAKNAQEAHEAIRPTDMGRLPPSVANRLDPDQARLYELIWTRTIASQMESATLERTSVEIQAEVGPRRIELRATGQVVKFDGFLRLYREDRDDPAEGAAGEEDDERRLPPMSAGDALQRRNVAATQHFTEPPPRFSEASLVKRMEELGIGRPSTYAAILAVLREREYVKLEKKRLAPEDKGRLVVAFLESFFRRYVEYDFTADLEEQLDRVSNNEIDWKQVLRDFWTNFASAVDGTKELRTGEVLDALNELLGPHIFPPKPDGSNARACPNCSEGQLSLKLGKFGAFIGCSNYPECRYTRQLAVPAATGEEGSGTASPGVRVLGDDPDTGQSVTIRDGRFGTFIQLGEAEDGEKPKRSSIPKGVDAATLELERALRYLALPREIARHPESGEAILAGIGRYGPYVQHGRTYANLGADDDVLAIGANRAVDLVMTKEAGGPGGRRAADPGKALGVDPESGKSVALKAGKYGPYVTDGETNATLPREQAPDALTLEEALQLLSARRAAGPSKPKRGGARARSASPAKPAAKGATAAKRAPAKAKKAAPKRAKT